MPPSSNLAQLIAAQAAAQGVPPSIALAVAQKESSIQQFTSSGGVVTGAAGEIGVFQLMPMTAASLGVTDPTDTTQNVQGGVSFLAQLYAKYGNWPQALSAYNSGSPNGSPSYATSVLGIAGNFGAAAPALPASLPDVIDAADVSAADNSSTFGIDPNLLIIGGIAAALAVVWWMD